MNHTGDKTLSGELSAEVIKHGLRTRWLGQSGVFSFDVVESTNAEAKRLAQEGAPQGTLIVADAQAGGRGRLGRTWVSPSGSGLYVSVVLRPAHPPEWSTRLTLAAGVAAACAIQQVGSEPRLKWPNDILIADRKVGGILTQVAFNRKQIEYAVLGIGINVNTEQDEFPMSIRDLATSLRLSLGKSVSRINLLQSLLQQFEYWHESLDAAHFSTILGIWSEFDTTLGRFVEVSLPGRRVIGIAEALEPDGSLLVRDETDRLHRIVAGDVVHCRPASMK